MNAIREFFSELAYGVAGVLVYVPIFVLQLLVLLLNPSWRNLGLAAIALLFSFGLWIGVVGAFSGLRIRDVHKFIATFPASRFEPVDERQIDEMLTPAMRAGVYLGSFVKATKRSLTEGLNVYRVKLGGRDKLAGPLASYQTLPGKSFIFLHESIKTPSPYQKFSFMHEIGHSSKRAASGLIREVIANTWVWRVAWICLFIHWDQRSGASLALLLLAQAVFWFDWDLWPRNFSNFTLRSEIEADRFALHGLNAAELEELKQTFAEYPQQDPILEHRPPERGNLFRNFMLLREVELIQLKGSPPTRPPLESIGRKMLLKNLATLLGCALLGQSPEPWKIWTAGVVAILLTGNGIYCVRRAHWQRGRAEHILRSRSYTVTKGAMTA